MYWGCECCEDRTVESDPPTFVVVVMMGKWGCAGGGDAGSRILELSAPWRIGDLRGGMRRRRGGPFLGPLGCLWSRTHLSLRESAEETLESDIHPPSTSPSLHFRDAMHDGHCHSASRVTSLSLSVSLFLCLGENINAVVLLADIHTTPTPFIEIRQLRTPCRERDDNSCKRAR